MGTFHQNKDPLHGITVVVDTPGPEIWIGRCDDVIGGDVILLDADRHQDGEGGRSKSEWVSRAAQVGHWARHARVVVPRDAVASIRRLGEIETP